MFSRFVRCVSLGGCLSLLAGCYMVAPIHTWQPPALESTVGKRVVLQSVDGPAKRADRLQEKLLAWMPTDAGRQTAIVKSNELLKGSHVRLASATDESPSDVALASIARQHGIDYVLRGQVMPQLTEVAKESGDVAAKPDSKQPTTAEPKSKGDQRLTVSWRLMSLGDRALS